MKLAMMIGYSPTEMQSGNKPCLYLMQVLRSGYLFAVNYSSVASSVHCG